MKLIKLTQDKFAIVDDIDYEVVNKKKWYYGKEWGYAKREENDGGKSYNYFLHQMIIELMYGEYDKNKLKADHINRNTLDNRRNNLRLINAGISCHNRNPFKGKKYKGVSKRKNGTYQVDIQCKKKKYYLGSFKTEKEAAIAYNIKAKELYGEFAYQNKIGG
jgi:hypothetical protein